MGLIGGIGFSLLVLGLQLTFPASAPSLTIHNASGLFTSYHAPLLCASLLPALVLCYCLRSTRLERITRGFTAHSSFVPIYVVSILVIFWIVAAAKGLANPDGIHTLSTRGWLFILPSGSSAPASSWNYWRLFDFGLVRWSALGAATQNILLLVLIGVLNLPIYVPAMAMTLKTNGYSMNHELLGHAVANFLSGCVGSVPNLVVLSNTRMFTFAGGGRPEALVVTAVTVGFFFISAKVLPYIPTVLAAVLVLFLGLDLMIEAFWATASELVVTEWLIVVGTAVCCTVIGFLPGFGIGLGLALVNHFFNTMLLSSVSRARSLEKALSFSRFSNTYFTENYDQSSSKQYLYIALELSLL